MPGKKRKEGKAWSRGKGKENDNAILNTVSVFGTNTVEEERKQGGKTRKTRKKRGCLSDRPNRAW